MPPVNAAAPRRVASVNSQSTRASSSNVNARALLTCP